MHPINHLFEDIYRNYWGILPATERPEARRTMKATKRDRKFRPERRSD